ncbi:porin family protein [Zunongwangia sp.]|uniref:porin family protein n=1 Tax=Zunongwangia sp. TaxID=1965325 RepID=UPI003AA97964
MFKNYVIALLMIVGVSVSAQNVDFGVKGGLNFATMAGDASEADGVTSVHIGGLAEIGLNDFFAIQPEIMYSGQGADFDGVELQIDYINVPVLAKFLVADGFSLEVGPQFGFKVNSEVKQDNVSVDNDDYTNTFDFSAAFGASYKLDSGLFFQARYNRGLTNVFEDEYSFNDADSPNSVFQLSVGYMF